MKQIIILTLMSMTLFAMEIDYNYLQKSKESYKKQHRQQRAIKKAPKHSVESSLYKNYIKIMYKNPSKIDMNYLKKSYNLTLYKCIAKNSICIFIYEGNLSVESIIQNIKRDENAIKVVENYKKYELKAF